MDHFDLIIIGAGSGNSILSEAFDSWKVAIVEEGAFGGTCLNRGCIPTKMFVHAADLAEAIRHSSDLGIDGRIDAIRWRDIRNRVFGRIDPIAVGGEDYRANRCANVTVYKGRGTFTSPRSIAIGSTEITADRIDVYKRQRLIWCHSSISPGSRCDSAHRASADEGPAGHNEPANRRARWRIDAIQATVPIPAARRAAWGSRSRRSTRAARP